MTQGSAPLLGPSFGTKIEVFQWEDPLESQALVWLGTKKPETAVQNLTSPVSRVRIWILQKLIVPTYSPQSSESFCKYRFYF